MSDVLVLTAIGGGLAWLVTMIWLFVSGRRRPPSPSLRITAAEASEPPGPVLEVRRLTDDSLVSSRKVSLAPGAVTVLGLPAGCYAVVVTAVATGPITGCFKVGA